MACKHYRGYIPSFPPFFHADCALCFPIPASAVIRRKKAAITTEIIVLCLLPQGEDKLCAHLSLDLQKQNLLTLCDAHNSGLHDSGGWWWWRCCWEPSPSAFERPGWSEAPTSPASVSGLLGPSPTPSGRVTNPFYSMRSILLTFFQSVRDTITSQR